MWRWASIITALGWALAAGCGGGPECARDADCAAGLYCREGDCVFDCADDTDCLAGTACTARGRCEAGCVESNGGVMVPMPGHPIWIDAYEMTVYENADCSGQRDFIGARCRLDEP